MSMPSTISAALRQVKAASDAAGASYNIVGDRRCPYKAKIFESTEIALFGESLIIVLIKSMS